MGTLLTVWRWFRRIWDALAHVHLFVWILDFFSWRSAVIAGILAVASGIWARLENLPGPVILTIILVVLVSALAAIRLALAIIDWFRSASQLVPPHVSTLAAKPEDNQALPTAAIAAFSAPDITNSTMLRPLDLDKYSQKHCFNYSQNSGYFDVKIGLHTFTAQFGSCSTASIYFIRAKEDYAICRIQDASSGDRLDFRHYDSTSRHYDLRVGEHFMIRNEEGSFLQGRILSIKCRGADGAPNDEVCFAYALDTTDSGKMLAL